VIRGDVVSERTAASRAPRLASHRSASERERSDDVIDASSELSTDRVAALQRRAGNHAVTQLMAARQSQAPTIQRWAWVSAAQVQPNEPGLDPAMKTFAADKVVRDYGSMGEFKDHAAGKTDYLGTLPAASASPGTWVRFAPSGINLLGEDHTKVTLEHVVPAVRTTSFIYEPFATDDLSASPAMKSAYETENADRFKAFGVQGAADKRQFGAESLFPKIAFGFNLLLPYATGASSLDDLKPGQYVGQPLQRYLKIAWGFAADAADQVAAAKQAKKPVPADLQGLATTYQATKGDLDAFITGLPVDGYLGDALDTANGKKKLPSLEKLCRAVLAAMLARMTSDAGLSAPERQELGRMPKGSSADQMAAFGKWRNFHFSHAVRDAAAKGVRYAGMGLEHLKYLRAEGLPPKSADYDMVAKNLIDFETLTKNLAASAKSP
jgi:hypothetical protein